MFSTFSIQFSTLNWETFIKNEYHEINILYSKPIFDHIFPNAATGKGKEEEAIENVTDRELNTPGIGQQCAGPGPRDWHPSSLYKGTLINTRTHTQKHTHTHTHIHLAKSARQAMDRQSVQSKFELCFGFLRGRNSV